MVSCGWLPLINRVFPKFIHVGTCNSSSFHFLADNKYFIEWINNVWCIYSSKDALLVCWPIWLQQDCCEQACTQVFVWMCNCSYLEYIPSGIAKSYDNVVFDSLRKSMIISKCKYIFVTLQWLPKALRMKLRFSACATKIFYDPGPACISNLPFHRSPNLPNHRHTGLLPQTQKCQTPRC